MKSIDHNFDISKELGLEDLPNEVWKDIPDYEGLYQVSNLGRVKSLERIIYKPTIDVYQKRYSRIMKTSLNEDGYRHLNLKNEGKSKDFLVHRLVALAFILNPENKTQIDHINTVRTDNRVENLRWVTPSENVRNPITLSRISGVNHRLYGVTGKDNPSYGRHPSEETRAKLRAMFSGKNNPFYGKKHSEETIKILREKHPNKIKVINLTTGAIFISQSEAERFYNLPESSIHHAIRKHTRSGGCHWGYYKE